MARSRSFFAASNRGKAGEVFLNNVVAASQRSAKQKARAKAANAKKAARAEQSAANARLREREASRRRAAREEEKRRRDAEKLRLAEARAHALMLKEQAKADKKLAQMVNRAKLLCEKHDFDIAFAEELAEIAIDADLSPAALERDLVLPRLRSLRIRGALEQFRQEIMPDRFERFLSDLTETEIAVEQVSTLAQIEHLRNHKVLEDFLADLLTNDEILVDDYEDLKAKTWPSLPLDEFQEKYGLPELRARKKRVDFLVTAVVEGRIRQEEADGLLKYLEDRRTSEDAIPDDPEFLKCVKTKVDFDKTKHALQEIWESKSLEYDDYLDFEEFAIESLAGADLTALRRDDLYIGMAKRKAESIENIKKIEQQWMPGLISAGELNTADGPGEEFQSHGLGRMKGMIIESYSSLRAGQFVRWFFLGFCGAHRFYAGRKFSGGLMLLAFAFLLLSGGPKIGESGFFIGAERVEKGTHFDQIVLLKRNANLREGPSTNTRIKASLKVSQRPSFQVVRQVNGGDWYEVREVRSLFYNARPDEGVKQFWMVGLDNLANEIWGARRQLGLLQGYIYKDLITIDTSDTSPAMNFFSSLEVFIALVFLWIFDFFLLVARSPLVMPSKRSKKIYI